MEASISLGGTRGAALTVKPVFARGSPTRASDVDDALSLVCGPLAHLVAATPIPFAHPQPSCVERERVFTLRPTMERLPFSRRRFV